METSWEIRSHLRPYIPTPQFSLFFEPDDPWQDLYLPYLEEGKAYYVPLFYGKWDIRVKFRTFTFSNAVAIGRNANASPSGAIAIGSGATCIGYQGP